MEAGEESDQQGRGGGWGGVGSACWVCISIGQL